MSNVIYIFFFLVINTMGIIWLMIQTHWVNVKFVFDCGGF